MRAIVCAFVAALCLLQLAQAKFVSVTGQGVILAKPPANVFNRPDQNGEGTGDDLEGPHLNDMLAYGAFDEKRVKMAADFAFTPSITLKKDRTYDSHFLFFHQKWLTDNNDVVPKQAADAVFTIDNRFIGCSSSNGKGNDGEYEVESTPLFGLIASVAYPNTTFSARGFESGDLASGTGTQVKVNSTIRQPGDFVRCVSITCADDNDNNCVCGVNLNAFSGPSCVPADAESVCFNTVDAAFPSAAFTSTCPYVEEDSQDSLVLGVGTCNPGNGCSLTNAGDGFCLNPSASTPAQVTIHATAACSCVKNIVVTLNACAPPPPPPPPPPPACVPQVVSTECTSASVHSSTGYVVGLAFSPTAPAKQCDF